MPELPTPDFRELSPDDLCRIHGGTSVRRIFPVLDRWPSLPRLRASDPDVVLPGAFVPDHPRS